MSELQQNNDTDILKKHEYIHCLKRSSRPRIDTLVCDQCKDNKKCADYQCFKQGINKEKFEEELMNRRKKRRIKRKKNF